MLSFLFWVLFVVYVFSCLVLVLVILNQEPKGSGVGAMFGQGSMMGEALGVAGMQTTLRSITRWCAGAFFTLSIVLALLGQLVWGAGAASVLPPPEIPAAPAAAMGTTLESTELPDAGAVEAAGQPLTPDVVVEEVAGEGAPAGEAPAAADTPTPATDTP